MLIFPDMKTILRFESKIVKENTHWAWKAGRVLQGYGRFWFQGKTRRAHRIAWIIYRGKIPAGLEVCHKCDYPPCVNPEHLFLGTHRDNWHDAINKGRAKWSYGERHGMAKLTWRDVEAIRRDDRHLKDIAADYGVIFQTISLIKLNKTWRKRDNAYIP